LQSERDLFRLSIDLYALTAVAGVFRSTGTHDERSFLKYWRNRGSTSGVGGRYLQLVRRELNAILVHANKRVRDGSVIRCVRNDYVQSGDRNVDVDHSIRNDRRTHKMHVRRYFATRFD